MSKSRGILEQETYERGQLDESETRDSAVMQT